MTEAIIEIWKRNQVQRIIEAFAGMEINLSMHRSPDLKVCINRVKGMYGKHSIFHPLKFILFTLYTIIKGVHEFPSVGSIRSLTLMRAKAVPGWAHK